MACFDVEDPMRLCNSTCHICLFRFCSPVDALRPVDGLQTPFIYDACFIKWELKYVAILGHVTTIFAADVFVRSRVLSLCVYFGILFPFNSRPGVFVRSRVFPSARTPVCSVPELLVLGMCRGMSPRRTASEYNLNTFRMIDRGLLNFRRGLSYNTMESIKAHFPVGTKQSVYLVFGAACRN